VTEGDLVETGATLVILEAMKMEHAIKAPHAGRVHEVRTRAVDQVEGGQLLVLLSD
jgi:biotin carboxyl carrier protein